MGLKSNNFLYLLAFVVLIIGMIFTDLPIYKYTVTHSLMIFIAPLIFLLIFFLNNFKLKLSKNARIFSIYALVTFLVSLFYILYFIFLKEEYYAYGKNIFIKHFEAFISLTLLHFLIYFLLFFILTKLNLDIIKKILISVFIFLTLIAIIEYFNPNMIEIFHSFPKNYDRLRLLSMEPSHAIVIYFIFGFLSFILIRDNFLKVVLIAIMLVISILIRSKGFFISILISLSILFFKNFYKLKYIPIYLILICIAIFLFINFALSQLLVDIKNFSSFSTRFSSIISAFVILFTNPFGLGYGSYLITYPEILDNSYKIANNLFISFFNISLSYKEISSIISTGKHLGPKAGIPQTIMFNGWIGLIFWLIIFKNTLTYIKKLHISIASKNLYEFFTIFFFIQLFIGSEYTLLYVIWLPLALIESMYSKQKKTVIQ